MNFERLLYVNIGSSFFKKCTTLASDIDNKDSYVCVAVEGIWGISVTSFQFVINLKLFYKIMSYKFNLINSDNTLGSKEREGRQ